MKQLKWFNRTFDFSSNQQNFPSVIKRLEELPARLQYKTAQIPLEQLNVCLKNTWSIKENIGHLIDLEPIWQGRLDDILNAKKQLRIADLENKKTDLAKHNLKNIDDLIADFSNIRATTIKKLNTISEKDIGKHALHPRLKKPMRIIDLFLFVAEHDKHHLQRISNIHLHLTTHSTSFNNN